MPVYQSIKNKDGDPRIFLHYCPEELIGTAIPDDELEDFAARCIVDAYRTDGATVRVNARRRNGGSPHFILERPYGKVAVVVNINRRHLDDLTELKFRYDEYGEVPRIIIAEVYCLESGGRENIRGGNYSVKFTAVAPLAELAGKPKVSPRTDNDVLDVLGNAWAENDASQFAPVLHPCLKCVSYVRMDVIPSAEEFMRYIQNAMDRFRREEFTVSIRSVFDNVRGVKGILTRVDNVYTFMEVKITDGYVTEVITRRGNFLNQQPEREEYIDIPNSDTSLHYRMAAVVGAENVEDCLKRYIRKGYVIYSLFEKAQIDDISGVTSVKILRYGEDPNFVATIAGQHHANKFYERVTTYPVFLDGVPYKMRIKGVEEYPNCLEARVTAEVNGMEVVFFATDYAAYRNQYQANRWGWFNLSALALVIKPCVEEREYRNDGAEAEAEAVRPVQRRFTRCVEAADEGMFTTELLSIEEVDIAGEDFRRAFVSLGRIGGVGDEMMVPLFYRADPGRNFRNGDNVVGRLWLMGEIDGATNRTYEEDEEPA